MVIYSHSIPDGIAKKEMLALGYDSERHFHQKACVVFVRDSFQTGHEKAIFGPRCTQHGSIHALWRDINRVMEVDRDLVLIKS